jgi:hypothetical protein
VDRSAPGAPGRVRPSARIFAPGAGSQVPRLSPASGFFARFSDRERELELALAASRLAAVALPSDGPGGRQGQPGGVGGAGGAGGGRRWYGSGPPPSKSGVSAGGRI